MNRIDREKKTVQRNNHTRWYKSEENDPLQAMMLAGDICLVDFLSELLPRLTSGARR